MDFILSRRAALGSLAGCAGWHLAGLSCARAASSLLQHQPGIATPQEPFLYFLTFDLTAEKRQDVIDLMRRWTRAADALMAGKVLPGLIDPEDAEGLSAKGLTLTFGFGPGLFIRDGKDRYNLAALRPAPLADLPRFNGDQLVAAHTGGDLCVQSCAGDPQTAFHAVRILASLAYGAATPRWAQTGFMPDFGKRKTPRNLMGFKDGTINPDISNPKIADRVLWAAPGDLPWMQGGTYLVARIIRMALEHWDRMKVAFQEETMGRQKQSGAPIGGHGEFEPLTLKQTDRDGNPITAQGAHARLAAPEENDGAQILRRAYAYDNGLSYVAERWPPWRQGNEFDAGLMFLAYQQDPRTGFTKIFERMSKFDMMNQFTTHVGGGLFACPGRLTGGYVGQTLLEV
ncbi:Dyp-type peroxidase [Acetobacter sp.]|jgi:deferrochelatase/peroxidase EfeB|uniref:Dyp-type peroxidase n=1 Tax=Acetobacter sp. TaxID=440 RepID=UPI0025C3D25C|nr:Dyp-type peroxidase [Acetobacter sp.]MCH4091645.1 Dyp-type peroxidase [Acetobacter sp.]MCI1300937.1 Dyp-type peroxidase [Acetobacter sp.]MCI1316186.1 Dyp-type peroxidase [Acetobacter sp.]